MQSSDGSYGLWLFLNFSNQCLNMEVRDVEMHQLSGNEPFFWDSILYHFGQKNLHEPRKKNLVLSMKYWLFHRDPGL